MKLAVFAYNFPHKRTQDFLLRLVLEGYRIELVVAADPVQLNLPAQTLRAKPVHTDLIHPEVICRRLEIPYCVLPHNSPDVARLMNESGIEVAVIAGARILKRHIIESVGKGIVNFHPGLIPEVRGLDALKWAIYRDLPIGITAHFIDERIDAGRIILREQVPVNRDDTLVDVSLRLAETQNVLLPRVLTLVSDKSPSDFPLVSYEGKANPPMPPEVEKLVPGRLAERLARIN